MRDLLDDPMPTTDPRPGFQWARNEFGWCQERAPKKKGQTPHAKLKKACLLELSPWRQRTGAETLLVPLPVGVFTINPGKANERKIGVGRKGASDHLIVVGNFGVLWGIVFPEYKAQGDYQRHAQGVFQTKAERVGAIYVLVRKPSDLTDSLDQIAAQRGRGPFG